MATPFQERSPFQTAPYQAEFRTSAGKAVSVAFSSCRHATSGCEDCSQASRLGNRLLMSLTLNVAIFTAASYAGHRERAPNPRTATAMSAGR